MKGDTTNTMLYTPCFNAVDGTFKKQSAGKEAKILRAFKQVLWSVVCSKHFSAIINVVLTKKQAVNFLREKNFSFLFCKERTFGSER